MTTRYLAAKAIFAFLACPGIVAFAIPLVMFRPTDPAAEFFRPALVVVALGSTVLLWCTREFYVAGRGTLAPWSPPTQLVRSGLYQFSRNPMYIGVLLIVSGWALGFRSTALGYYVAGLVLLFEVRVMVFEEPWLAARHGSDFLEYRAAVPRWLLIKDRSAKR